MTQVELSAYIKSTFAIFRKNLLKILILAFLIYVPVSVMQLMLPELDMSGATQENAASYYEKLLVLLLSAVLLSLVSGIFDMAVIYFVREDYKTAKVPLSEAFDFSIRRFPKYFATKAVGYLVSIVLTMFCFFPGIIAMFLFSLSSYIVVLRDVWGRRALKESSLIVRKNALFVIVVILIQYAAAYFFSFGMSMATNLLKRSGFNNFVVNGIWVVMNVVIYALLSVMIIFITLIAQRLISSSPELNKDPQPEQ